MDRHVLSVVIVLHVMLLVAVQAHTGSQEDINSSSSQAASLVVNSSANRTIVNAGDPPPAIPWPPKVRSESSSPSHEAIIMEELHATSFPRHVKVPASSFASNSKSTTGSAIAEFSSVSLPVLLSPSLTTGSSIAGLDDLGCGRSSAIDESSVAGDSVASSRFNSDKTSATTTTQVTYVFSRADDDASQSITSSYSTGTVQPNNTPAQVESAALEFSAVESTALDQVDESASRSPSTTPRPRKIPASSNIGSSSSGQDDRAVLTASDSALSSPIFYACVVLGVVGVVGAVVASRAKRQRNDSENWRGPTEAFARASPPAHPSAWAPPASEVHVVIDDQRFALL